MCAAHRVEVQLLIYSRVSKKLKSSASAFFWTKFSAKKISLKSAPPPPQKMPFSSDLCHFKIKLAQFKKNLPKL